MSQVDAFSGDEERFGRDERTTINAVLFDKVFVSKL